MPSRHNIEHVTVIQAPIDAAWASLIDLEDWKTWNKWTLLEAEKAEEGVHGKLRACYEGDDQWQTFDFVLGAVEKYSLTWGGSIGPGGIVFLGKHTMRLETVDANTTRLIHEEQFGGLLPLLGVGLPYKTLHRNYLLINEAFKKHVEGK